MSYNDWVRYISEGSNVLYNSGGVIPSGTLYTLGGLSGNVYTGNVRQGWGN